MIDGNRPPDDVERLRLHVLQCALQPVAFSGGWGAHMGAVITDAALQPRTRYQTVVAPRVRALLEAWPEATTVSRFRDQLSAGDIGAVLSWRGPKKLAVIQGIADALAVANIDSTADLATAYVGTQVDAVLGPLLAVRGVGPKTFRYLALLVGCNDFVAIDVRLRRFASAAGVRVHGYRELHTIYVAAVRQLGWHPAELDRAVWRYQEKRQVPKVLRN